MDTLYKTTIERVRDGAQFRVDFKKRTLYINNKKVDLNSMPSGIEHYTDLDEWLDKVEDLYDDYKYSRPSRTASMKERHSKFKALSVNELIAECGHNALNNPMGREEAKAALELFILLSLVDGSFNPDELFTRDWFYQGGDKSFIMLKDWF